MKKLNPPTIINKSVLVNERYLAIKIYIIKYFLTTRVKLKKLQRECKGREREREGGKRERGGFMNGTPHLKGAHKLLRQYGKLKLMFWT